MIRAGQAPSPADIKLLHVPPPLVEEDISHGE